MEINEKKVDKANNKLAGRCEDCGVEEGKLHNDRCPTALLGQLGALRHELDRLETNMLSITGRISQLEDWKSKQKADAAKWIDAGHDLAILGQFFTDHGTWMRNTY